LPWSASGAAPAKHLLIALDDDQTILAFAGADPATFTDPGIPVHFEKVLPQSYRIPRSHHALSQAWIQQVSSRKSKIYQPRDAEGELRRLHHHCRYPDPNVRDLEPYLATGKSIMILATSAYLLEPLRQRLLDRGIPFANPYRSSSPEWNPLAAPPRGTFPARRFLSLLKPFLTPEQGDWFPRELELWLSWLSAHVLRPDALKRVRMLKPPEPVTKDVLETLLEPAAYQSLIDALTATSPDSLIAWWLDHLAPSKRPRGRYLYRIARRGGLGDLQQPPQITIGTGHSVKGAEADVVYVFPDLSPSAYRQWNGSHEQRDALIRLGYVMITRARESLILCDPSGPGYLPFATCLPKL
jgi:superfamily I DNA/RNA helicase